MRPLAGKRLAYLEAGRRNGRARCGDGAVWPVVAPDSAEWLCIRSGRKPAWIRAGTSLGVGVRPRLVVGCIFAFDVLDAQLFGPAMGLARLADLPNASSAAGGAPSWTSR